MSRFFHLPSRRRLLILLAIVVLPLLAYAIWEPGRTITDGRHDRGRNGLWMQHAWLGDDAWFKRNHREDRRDHFRDPATLAQTAAHLQQHHIADLFPHLCPCNPSGAIPPVDDPQTERFLNAFAPPQFRVLPWVGGVQDVDAFPTNPKWRAGFLASINDLLTRHPRLAGIHVNIEPLPSGDAGYLTLLTELRAALPKGKLISVAAYPPPTLWHRFPEVHWEEAYFRQVAARTDQVAVMLYDTSLRSPKFYRKLMRDWTAETLLWAGDTPVLLGVPAYEDAGVGYHHPDVENLTNSLAGIHAAISSPLPANYQGVSIYADWEMTDAKWSTLRGSFFKP